ncbi:MAG: hypothetical protein KDC69_06230 [Flavobacteriaceae bacterium]|nr:hypothetical protein [Flavobacteriaceae bacterium]
MIALDKTNNADILRESVAYLQGHGFEHIKADVDGFETPTSYHKKDSDVVITPDIVAEHHGKKHYFDISIKSQEPDLLKSKWKFLETLSRIKGHQFRIITSKGHYKFTREMLQGINLDKEPIKLS